MLSLFVVSTQTLLMIAISGLIEPFKSKTSNTLDIINESFILLTIYSLICSTDFVTDKMTQNWVGYSQITIICLSISINIIVIVTENSFSLARAVKISWLKAKQRWAI